MHAREMHAYKTHAHEIYVYEMHEFLDLSPSLPMSRRIGDALDVIFEAGVADP